MEHHSPPRVFVEALGPAAIGGLLLLVVDFGVPLEAVLIGVVDFAGLVGLVPSLFVADFLVDFTGATAAGLSPAIVMEARLN